MLWTFVESCVRGQLGFGECGPVYQLAIIVAFLLAAVVILIRLILRRKVNEQESP